MKTLIKALWLVVINGVVLSHSLSGQGNINTRKKKARTSQETPALQPTPPPSPVQQPTPSANPALTSPSELSSGSVISGVIKDSESNEPLVGVYVTLVGTTLGAISDAEQGKFVITTHQPLSFPFQLSFQSVGYSNQTLTINQPSDLQTIQVMLKEEVVLTETVVISASRQSEQITTAPISIQKLDLLAMREAPALSAYDAAMNYRGMEQITSSINFKTINTRGFNTSLNLRFMQVVDGVDLQLPGLSFPLGNINGPGDVDIESIELIAGAASALYGPNAFNGLMSFNTKSPFNYPGLSVMLRTGVNHVDNYLTSPKPYFEGAIRYAAKVSESFGVKFTLSGQQAHDWMIDDPTDIGLYQGTLNQNLRIPPGPGNPGYNAISRNGDTGITFPLTLPNGTRQVLLASRTGIEERDIADSYNVHFLRANMGLHYKINDKIELVYAGQLTHCSSFTTLAFGNSRGKIVNGIPTIQKLELKSKNLMLRTSYSKNYMDRVDVFVAIADRIINQAKPLTAWYNQYIAAFTGQLNPLLQALGQPQIQPFNDQQARAYADGNNTALFNGFYQVFRSPQGGGLNEAQATQRAQILTMGKARFKPGTQEFNDALAAARQKEYNEGGGIIKEFSSMWQNEIQYNLQDHIKFAEVMVGGNYRRFINNTGGTIMTDTADVLVVNEIGGFLQVQKKFFDNRFKVNSALRYDKSDGFEGRVTPRIAFVVSVDKKRRHNLRTSYQTGFRLPSMQERFFNLYDPSRRLRFIGGFDADNRQRGLIINHEGNNRFINSYTYNSVLKFQNTQDSSVLVRAVIPEFKPEYVKTFELGYNGSIRDKFRFDISGYHNWFENFLFYQFLVGPRISNPNKIPILKTSDLKSSTGYDLYFRALNAVTEVRSYGAYVDMAYAITSQWILSGNYSYNDYHIVNEEQNKGQDRVVFFNTPLHKVNVSLTARNLFKHFGFVITHKWSDTFSYNMVDGFEQVPAFNVFDAQISYKLPSYKSTVRIGGTNILNNRHIELYYGPWVGALYYVQFNYDGFLN